MKILCKRLVVKSQQATQSNQAAWFVIINSSGATGENRTRDLFITNEVHYHCATGAKIMNRTYKSICGLASILQIHLTNNFSYIELSV